MEDLAKRTGLKPACDALGLSRATVYRRRRPPSAPRPRRPRRPGRALSPAERQEVLDLLHSEDFIDKQPEAIVALLLTKGRWICSARTMYRILAEEGELHERRRQRRHPEYKRPELMATAPNQVWSWDVTWLRGPTPGVYFYLYVILDIFSRLVVGWTLARREDTDIAMHLVKETCNKQNIEPDQLNIHADRGAVQTAKNLVDLYRELAVRPSHSRPHVSDDNPYSEAHFKTLKYSPDYPDRFANWDDALAYCRRFFPWYNHEHRHSGIAFLTPADVHYGRVDAVLAVHSAALAAAYAAHPERFVHGLPTPKRPPAAVYINPPRPDPGAVLEHDGLPQVAPAVDPRLNPIKEILPTTDFNAH
jgi:transposase InsO family protein